MYSFSGNFLEAYRNLSYKHAMGLRWASSHRCLQPKFIIKMDDDVVVDFRQLFAYIQTKWSEISSHPAQHYLAGYAFRKVLPIRLRPSKWFVTQQEFSGKIYPDYLSGWMYITTPNTARSLVKASVGEKSAIFWIDDIWITGILRDKLNISISETLNHLYSANPQFIDCCINDLKKFRYKCPFIAGPNGGEHELIIKLAHTIKKQCYRRQEQPNFNTCSNRDSNIPSIKDTCIGVDKHLLLNDRGSAIIKAIKV